MRWEESSMKMSRVKNLSTYQQKHSCLLLVTRIFTCHRERQPGGRNMDHALASDPVPMCTGALSQQHDPSPASHLPIVSPTTPEAPPFGIKPAMARKSCSFKHLPAHNHLFKLHLKAQTLVSFSVLLTMIFKTTLPQCKT